ncbi:unnamed protein product, partial [Gulo gulo]
RVGFWGEARGGTVNGKAARQRGCCGLSFSPPAPTPRPGLGLARDSASLGRISHGSPEPGDSQSPSSRRIDRGVRCLLPLLRSGNYCPGAGAEK